MYFATLMEKYFNFKIFKIIQTIIFIQIKYKLNYKSYILETNKL